MASSKISRLKRQHENTWADLQRRLMCIPFDYSTLFPNNVFEFIQQSAVSMSSCIGYLVPCLLSTTSFVMGINSLISNEDRCFPCNLYVMVIGPPATGKSQAMKYCAVDPIITLRDNCDIGNVLIERCTSSGLVKTLAEQKKGIVVSPELFDVLKILIL